MANPTKTHRPWLNCAWITAIGANWLVIVLSIASAWYWNHILGYALAVFVIGTRQHALAVLGHDGTHFHVSRNKWLNDFITNLLVAWPLAFSSSGYRRWHLVHHRTVGTDADPELMMYRMFGKKWSPDASRLKLFVTDLIGLGAFELLVLWHDLMQWRSAAPTRRRIEETFGLILWPLVAVGLPAVLWGWQTAAAISALWYGSLFTSFFAVYRLRCYSEHVGSEWTHRLSKPPLWERLVYLPANTWLHWEHHKWPGVPLRQFRVIAPALEAADYASSRRWNSRDAT